MPDHPHSQLIDPAEVTVQSLRRDGLSSPLGVAAKAWITSLTMEQDVENGPHFWDWLIGQLQLSDDPLYDTLFLGYRPTRQLIATASITHDDADLSRDHGIDGVWLSGLVVRREYRRTAKKTRGVGRLMIDTMLNHIQQRVDTVRQPLTVNSYRVGRASTVLLERGFSRLGHYYVQHFGFAADVYHRVFSPA